MDLYESLNISFAHRLVPAMRDGKRVQKNAANHRIRKQVMVLFVISAMIVVSTVYGNLFLGTDNQLHSILHKSVRNTLHNNVALIRKSDLYIRWKGLEKQNSDLLFTRFRQGDPKEDEERRRMVLNPSQEHSLSPLGRTPMGDRAALVWAHLLLILPLIALGIMQWWKQSSKQWSLPNLLCPGRTSSLQSASRMVLSHTSDV